MCPARIGVIGSKNAFCGSHAGYRPRAGSVQFAGTMVQTMVVWDMPMPINSPLKETVEAGVPAQVFDEPPPLQPVPETLLSAVVTTIFVKLPRVVENVPPSMLCARAVS